MAAMECGEYDDTVTESMRLYVRRFLSGSHRYLYVVSPRRRHERLDPGGLSLGDIRERYSVLTDSWSHARTVYERMSVMGMMPVVYEVERVLTDESVYTDLSDEGVDGFMRILLSSYSIGDREILKKDVSESFLMK